MDDRQAVIEARIIQYRRNRAIFYKKVFIIAIILILVTLCQWLLLALLDLGKEDRDPESKNVDENDLEGIRKFKHELKDYYYVAFPLLFLGLLLTSVFVLSNNVRFLFPLNWILTICIVECITLGMVWAVLESDWMSMLICAGIVFVVVVIFLIIGACIPGDLTLHVMVLFAFATIFVVGSIFTALWGLLAERSITILIYLGFIAVLVLMFIIYHTQTILGGRFAEMRLSDHLLAALIIYHDYVILYLICLFVYTVYVHTPISVVVAQDDEGNECFQCNKNITIVTIS